MVIMYPNMVVQKSVTTMVQYDEIVCLTKEHGVDRVWSTVFSCLGHEWLLEINPGGQHVANKDMVSIYLRHLSNKKINVKFGISANGCQERVLSAPYNFDHPSQCTRGGSKRYNLVFWQEPNSNQTDRS